MSHRMYTPEFKDEAVRQVVERGYTVKEVSERLGISAASLPLSLTNNGSTGHLNFDDWRTIDAFSHYWPIESAPKAFTPP